jgi:hypothetical protein
MTTLSTRRAPETAGCCTDGPMCCPGGPAVERARQFAGGRVGNRPGTISTKGRNGIVAIIYPLTAP